MEGLFGEGRDHDPLDRRPEVLQDRAEQVMAERPLGRDPLQSHGNGVRLPGADPDREIALALHLLEDDDVVARGHMDPDALDHDFDQLADHGGIIPRSPGWIVGQLGEAWVRPSAWASASSSASASAWA